MPKLYTSLFSFRRPLLAYSGATYLYMVIRTGMMRSWKIDKCYKASYMKVAYPKVPITLVVMWLSPAPNNLARPKSEILALNSSSNRILLDLMSRCTTFGSMASCKYASLHKVYQVKSCWKQQMKTRNKIQIDLRLSSAKYNFHSSLPSKASLLTQSSM